MDENRELDWLRKVRDLTHQFGQEQSLPRLFPAILDAAIELTGAERGYLVVVKSKKPDGGYRIKVAEGRGFGKGAVEVSNDQVSQTIVQKVFDRGEGLVTTDESGDAALLEVSSVRARRVRSIVCVPLTLRGEMRGALYLDHRFEQGAFSERDLPILSIFADQAALALETASLLADRSELGRTLQQLKAMREEAAGDPAAPRPAPASSRFGGLVGGTPVMGALYEEIEQAARARTPVLILGEVGVGKELVAREIHARSNTSTQPFFAVSCAQGDDLVVESELFGHRQGAFPGAVADRAGVLVDAGIGTVLLDEIADLSLELQGKLLSVLERGSSRPLGAHEPVPITCRVMATSRQDLAALTKAGRFREDLYYRIDVMRLVVPPLRQRVSDVPLLVEAALAQAPAAPKVSNAVASQLQAHHWPGNVRELLNEVQRWLSLGVRKVEVEHLSEAIRSDRGVAHPDQALSGKTLAEVEKEMIERALQASEGNKSRAARTLGVPRTTLYSLMERHGLS